MPCGPSSAASRSTGRRRTGSSRCTTARRPAISARSSSAPCSSPARATTSPSRCSSAAAQPPDDREYTYFAALTSHHTEAWDFLCESVPACRGEDAACRAALAVAGMAADYPTDSGGAVQVARLQSLLSQTTWPSARIYLFQALLSTPGAEGLDGARKALFQERDEEVRSAVLKMRPGLAK